MLKNRRLKRGRNEKSMRTAKERGITLIALIITIIVLLILTGVTIATLTGDNGILTKATEAKDKTEEGEEEEKVKLSAVGALAKDNGGEIKEGYLEEELSSQFGEKGTDYNLEGSGPFTVTIIESGRSYLINEDGTIGEAVKREGIKVGDYVNYTPDANETGYTTDKLAESITGSSKNTSAIKQDSLKWRILNIDASGRVDLISEEPTSQSVYFSKALGYNNGVLLINDICEELYSNNTLGIKARSLNIKDIEEQMNAEGEIARDSFKNNDSGTQYGKTKTYGSGYNQYPNLYEREKGSGINTEEVKKEGLDVNEKGYTTPTTETSSTANEGLTVTQTYYYMGNSSNYFDNSHIYNMIFETSSHYWLASRYAYCGSTYANFGIFYVGNSELNGMGMFSSSAYTGKLDRYLRPVVSLESDIQIIPVENADGSSESNMHQISK